MTARGVIWQAPAGTETPPTTSAILADVHVVGVGARGVLKLACFGTYFYHENCRKLKQFQVTRRRCGVGALLQGPMIYTRQVVKCRLKTSLFRGNGSSSAGAVARRQNPLRHWIASWWKTPLQPNEPLREVRTYIPGPANDEVRDG